MTLELALQTLVSHDILSAPVWEESAKSFVGNVDMRDIVNTIATTCKKHDVFESKKLSQLLGQEEIFTARSIKDLFNLSSGFHFFSATETTPILEVLKGMVENGDKNHRRALVFKDKEKQDISNLVSMISQASIINYIGTHRQKLGPKVTMTIEDLVHIDWEENRNKLVSITSSASMVDAFSLMCEKNVSGLAVVDEHGQLLGTIGSRDVKGLVGTDHLDFSRLRYTVREYINYIRQMSIDEKHPAISVRRSDTLATLIGKFASTHVHRIFVIDEHNTPVGVISTIDLLRILVTY